MNIMLDLRPEAQNKSTPEVIPNLGDTRNLPDYSQHTSSFCPPVKQEAGLCRTWETNL